MINIYALCLKALFPVFKGAWPRGLVHLPYYICISLLGWKAPIDVFPSSKLRSLNPDMGNPQNQRNLSTKNKKPTIFFWSPFEIEIFSSFFEPLSHILSCNLRAFTFIFFKIHYAVNGWISENGGFSQIIHFQ